MGISFVSNVKNSYSRGIVTIMVGGVFLFIPGLTMRTVIILVGSMLLLNGLISLILSKRKKGVAMRGFWSFQGVVNVLFGIVFITSPSVIVKIFIIFIGVILLIMGLLQMVGSLGTLSRSGWAWIFFVIALMTLASGVFLLSDPFKSAEAILPFLGVILILNGISEFFRAGQSGRRSQTYKGSAVKDINYEEV